MGGVKKGLKSACNIDLAISLDTATPFLGFERFTVLRRANVMRLNGESGNATVQETAQRICAARGIDVNTLRIVWGADLPQLANVEHLADIASIIRERAIEVLIVDPTYLCLLSGVRGDGLQASSLLDMGPLYSRVAQCSLEAGATPLLTVPREHKPLDLDDLTYAGVAEYARQWLLISRREEYSGDGMHKLWLNIGGSAGHSFLGHLDAEEGVIDYKFHGRMWKTTVSGYREAKGEQKAERDTRKTEERQADEWAVMKLIDDMTKAGEVAILTRIRNGSELSRPRTDGALERLRQQGVLVEYQTAVRAGNRSTKDATAYRRKEPCAT